MKMYLIFLLNFLLQVSIFFLLLGVLCPALMPYSKLFRGGIVFIAGVFVTSCAVAQAYTYW